MDIYARKKRETEEAADSNDGGSGGGGGNITLDELNHREEIATQEWRRLLEETRGVPCDVTADFRDDIVGPDAANGYDSGTSVGWG